MILIGFGLYAAYVPFGCILFDRLIATVNAVRQRAFLSTSPMPSGIWGRLD